VKHNTALGALNIVLAMLGFAGMDAMSKWLVADYSIGQMMWIRYGVFCLFAWFLVRRQGLVKAARTRRPWLQGSRAVLGLVESAIFVLAFKYLPLADVHAVAGTAPLIVIALGVLLLGERAGATRWLAVAAGFAGVLVIVRPGFRDFDDPGVDGVRRLRCGLAGRRLGMAVARRGRLGVADRHLLGGRAGAIRAHQGARLCRCRRGAAL
jgi:drug/metabolite transporter (DMT)-like permease